MAKPKQPLLHEIVVQRTLAGEALHEISNVLNTFTMNSSALHEEVQDKVPHEELEELTSMLEQASSQLMSLMTLIKDTLPGPPRSQPEDHDLAALLRGLGIPTHAQDGLPPVFGVESDLHVALQVLVDFIGDGVEADVALRQSVGPIGDLNTLLTLRFRTPGRIADRERTTAALVRHFKGGAALRNGGLGLSVTRAVFHNCGAETRVPGGPRWPTDEAPDPFLWLQVEFLQRD